jgi:hypothetical protein
MSRQSYSLQSRCLCWDQNTFPRQQRAKRYSLLYSKSDRIDSIRCKGASGVGVEKSSDGGRFIPRIIVSMGAARVEAVPELKYASNPDLEDFEYVVVKDLHERPSVGGEKYVSMEWVKDCLIAGRMFPRSRS